MIEWQKHIHSDPGILLGKPVVKGTRLSVEFILERFANGWTEQQVLENYPRLTRADIQAIFAYAYECMRIFQSTQRHRAEGNRDKVLAFAGVLPDEEARAIQADVDAEFSRIEGEWQR